MIISITGGKGKKSYLEKSIQQADGFFKTLKGKYPEFEFGFRHNKNGYHPSECALDAMEDSFQILADQIISNDRANAVKELSKLIAIAVVMQEEILDVMIEDIARQKHD